MKARPTRGFIISALGAAIIASTAVACLLDFPTLSVVGDGGSGIDGASAADGASEATPAGPFCAVGEGPPFCEDFDGVSFGQDGGPNLLDQGCALVRVSDTSASPPYSLLAKTLDASSAVADAFLGFRVPVKTMQVVTVNAAFNIAAISAAGTPRAILKLVAPNGQALIVEYQSDGIHAAVNASSVTQAANALPSGWFNVTLSARLLDQTFDVAVNGTQIVANQKGIGLAMPDAGQEAGAGDSPTISLLFGAERAMTDPDVSIHVDNIRVTTQ